MRFLTGEGWVKHLLTYFSVYLYLKVKLLVYLPLLYLSPSNI